jgi:short-subunit dehydrogenase
MSATFLHRYGPTALVAGASEGLGAAWAQALAARGCELLLVARRPGPLAAQAAALRAAHGVVVHELAADLGEPADLDRVLATAAARDVGFLVYNAACSPIGRFVDVSEADHRQVTAVNCHAPALLAHRLGRAMVRRGRGGIVLMSSMSGLQGTAMVAHYAATKAYLRVLAEGLGNELRPLGVTVRACVAGPVRTPAYLAGRPDQSSLLVPPAREPEEVVAATLATFPEAGNGAGGGASFVPVLGDRVAAFVMERLLPRGIAVELISAVTRRMYRDRLD